MSEIHHIIEPEGAFWKLGWKTQYNGKPYGAFELLHNYPDEKEMREHIQVHNKHWEESKKEIDKTL